MQKLIAWSVCFVLAGSLVACKKRSSAAASKENPFVNSLAMKFVPVPITAGPTAGKQVLFSIWDTRVEDYRAYAAARTEVDARWKSPGFQQGEDHPVVNVSWDDAKTFCAWLTEKERGEGKIGQDQEYRLPTDEEWSAAVGESKYPWGNDWPPPVGAGNYDPRLKVDNFPNTSPVGSFRANQYGLYDMGGNVWQWCEDAYRHEMNANELLQKYPALKRDGGGKAYRVVRGASWRIFNPDFLPSSVRDLGTPEARDVVTGFRCVLAAGPTAR